MSAIRAGQLQLDGTIFCMYSGVKLCRSLSPEYKCIRLQEYNQGQSVERFHKHVPAQELAGSTHWVLLRTLVLRYEEATAEQVVDAYLTRRGRAANGRFTSVSNHLRIVVEHPEPGVIRSHCGGDVGAWIDTVVRPEAFRASAENQKD